MLFNAVLNSLTYLVDDLSSITSIENQGNIVKIYTTHYCSTFTINKLDVSNTICYSKHKSKEYYNFVVQNNVLVEI